MIVFVYHEIIALYMIYMDMLIICFFLHHHDVINLDGGGARPQSW